MNSCIWAGLLLTSVTSVLGSKEWRETTPTSNTGFGGIHTASAICAWCQWMGLWSCVQNYCASGGRFGPATIGPTTYPVFPGGYYPTYVLPYGPSSGGALTPGVLPFNPWDPTCALCQYFNDAHCIYKYCVSGRRRGTGFTILSSPGAHTVPPSAYSVRNTYVQYHPQMQAQTFQQQQALTVQHRGKWSKQSY